MAKDKSDINANDKTVVSMDTSTKNENVQINEPPKVYGINNIKRVKAAPIQSRNVGAKSNLTGKSSYIQ
jgi:hypothetical protein